MKNIQIINLEMILFLNQIKIKCRPPSENIFKYKYEIYFNRIYLFYFNIDQIIVFIFKQILYLKAKLIFINHTKDTSISGLQPSLIEYKLKY